MADADRDAELAQLREEPDNLHLLGGYGPLLVGAVLLVMMVLLAPTIAPEQVVQTPAAPVATTIATTSTTTSTTVSTSTSSPRPRRRQRHDHLREALMLTVASDKLRKDRPTQVVLALVVAYSTLYWVPGCPLPRVMPWGVIAQGVIFGTSYALLAMGLILIYRTTRIVNFAYGAMGAMPGSVTVGLFVAKGVNYWVAIAIGLAIGAASGALIDLLVVRRFARSSRLVLTVATIGLAQILGAIGLIIGITLGTDALIPNITTPLSGSFSIRPYPIRGDHLLMLGVAPVVMAGLGWFLLRTDAGRAVRAAAENQDRALLLGVPVRRLQTLVWALAGGLATLTFITKAPFTGVVPGVLVGCHHHPARASPSPSSPASSRCRPPSSAASAWASPSGRSAGTCTPSPSST